MQPRNGIELQLKHDLRAMTHLDELPTIERSLKVRRVHILHANHTRHTGPFGAQNANGHLRSLSDHTYRSTTRVHEHPERHLLAGRDRRGRATISDTLGLATTPASMGQRCPCTLSSTCGRTQQTLHAHHSMMILHAHILVSLGRSAAPRRP